MPNIILVGYPDDNSESHFGLTDSITKIAIDLKQVKDTVITRIKASVWTTCARPKDTPKEAPYVIVRCDSLPNAKKFAERISALGHDVEYEAIKFIPGKKPKSK